jgi:hypothetical protein
VGFSAFGSMRQMFEVMGDWMASEAETNTLSRAVRLVETPAALLTCIQSARLAP